MLKLEKKQVKIVSVLIALVFIGSVVALALTQSGGIAAAAPSGTVGVIDTAAAMSQHPDMQNYQTQLQAAVEEVRKDFETNSANMNDQQKADYYMQCQQKLQQRQEELLAPLEKTFDDAVKKVADAKGLSVVIDKGAVVYGGVDITQDVVSRLGKK